MPISGIKNTEAASAFSSALFANTQGDPFEPVMGGIARWGYPHPFESGAPTEASDATCGQEIPRGR